MKATFLDQQGKANHFEMGCYGIGVTRTVQAAIEQCHDQDGIIWPKSLAPFQVQICLLDIKDDISISVCNKIYSSLTEAGIDVFLDDRDERPGVKFKDADLMGMPFRLVLGKKSLDQGFVELVHRKTKEVEKIMVEKVTEILISKVAQL